MNWKDYPHLFANGKFNVKSSDGKVWFFNLLWDSQNLSFRDGDGYYSTSFCKLIARPISDMSDEELNDCEDIWHDIVYGTLANQDRHISAKDAIKSVSDEYTHVLLHLLSIGVYPFDDDKDVIWRYENE